MTPTLVQHPSHAGAAARTDLSARARDWSEIQERMLVPLYEAVYERLEVGPGTRLLGLGCGTGLALLMAVSRGAEVTGVDSGSPERMALARERLLTGHRDGRATICETARLVESLPAEATRAAVTAESDSGAATADAPGRDPAAVAPYTLITAFEPIGCPAGRRDDLADRLTSAAPMAERGAPVVLAGWGPPERCATPPVLRAAAKLADPLRGPSPLRPARRDDLEEMAEHAGLRPDGSGRVSCPFGYADMDSAVRGLFSTGLFDAAVGATDRIQVTKELTEALHPHQRRDGTVWMPNMFRYLIARTR